MKTTLISTYPDITSFGLRTMSAYLRSRGHQTQMIFLPDPCGDDLIFGVDRYEDGILDEIIPLCRQSDLIGITLMTNYFDSAVQITKKIKSRLDVPVIWGGVHPTIRPDECLEFADMVCVGDGEEALLELAEKMDKGEDYSDVANIWIRPDGGLVRNPLRPLVADLDIYPMPDYSMEDHHIMIDGRIKPLTGELMKLFLMRGTVSASLKKIGYQTMTGRGCPHKCTYCINDTIKNLYEGQRYLRWRSTDSVIEEFLWVKENMPYVDYMWISDDAFTARSLKSLEEFFEEYRSRIGLPFTCLVSPLTVTEEKMDLLVDSGLFYLQMGLESGSPRIQELFNRKSMSNEKMMKAIRIINRYKDRMSPPSYDFILDVPYETKEDKMESLRFISRIPKPFKIQPFSLVLYPGTKLYQMARDDGLIADEKREIYAKSYSMREANYPNFLIALAKDGKFPTPLLKFFISRPVSGVLNSDFFRPFFKFLYVGLKGAKHVLRKALGIK